MFIPCRYKSNSEYLIVSNLEQGNKLSNGDEKTKEEEEGPYVAQWCSITTRLRYGKIDCGYNHTSYD